eukprot:scaffold2911_cov40-Tisochrysis_lutea.AAC.4
MYRRLPHGRLPQHSGGGLLRRLAYISPPCLVIFLWSTRQPADAHCTRCSCPPRPFGFRPVYTVLRRIGGGPLCGLQWCALSTHQSVPAQQERCSSCRESSRPVSPSTRVSGRVSLSLPARGDIMISITDFFRFAGGGASALPLLFPNAVDVRLGLVVVSVILGWIALLLNVQGFQAVALTAVAAIASYASVPLSYTMQASISPDSNRALGTAGSSWCNSP